MKKKIYSICTLLCTVLSLALWSSCDTIDENDRFVLVGEENIAPQAGDTAYVETEGGYHVPIIMEHQLLVEDYTGWLCTNCPNMAAFIEEELASNYKCVVVGLHPKGNSLVETTNPSVPYFGTEEASTYLTSCGGTGNLPGIAIGRKPFDDGKRLQEGATASTFENAKNLALTIAQDYNSGKAKLVGVGIKVLHDDQNIYHISAAAQWAEPQELDCKLQLWVIENGIMGYQFGAPNAANYEHNHVFRGTVNGTWGEDIRLAASADYTFVKTYQYKVPDNCVPGRCEVVAILYNDNGVINTTKVPLID